MKGVLSGVPYPVFWIDTASPEDDLTKAEDKLIPPPPACDTLAIRNYVTLFFSDPKNKLFSPFIFECEDENFCSVPESYADLLGITSDIWKSEFNKLEILNQLDGPKDGVTEEDLKDSDIDALSVGSAESNSGKSGLKPKK